MADEERRRWAARYHARGAGPPAEPSGWVIRHLLALPAGSLVLDVAAGAGRHAVPLARAGLSVVALDVVEEALRIARRAEPRVHGVVAEAARLPLRAASADAVLCVNFLDRSAFPHFASLLRPGGRLVVETFLQNGPDGTRTPDGTHRPSNPAFLLRPGELPALVAPMRILDAHEGNGRAGVVAER